MVIASELDYTTDEDTNSSYIHVLSTTQHSLVARLSMEKLEPGTESYRRRNEPANLECGRCDMTTHANYQQKRSCSEPAI